MSDAIHQQIRKQVELKAVAVGFEVKSDDPNRLRLPDALQQYIADRRLYIDACVELPIVPPLTGHLRRIVCIRIQRIVAHVRGISN